MGEGNRDGQQQDQEIDQPQPTEFLAESGAPTGLRVRFGVVEEIGADPGGKEGQHEQRQHHRGEPRHNARAEPDRGGVGIAGRRRGGRRRRRGGGGGAGAGRRGGSGGGVADAGSSRLGADGGAGGPEGGVGLGARPYTSGSEAGAGGAALGLGGGAGLLAAASGGGLAAGAAGAC